jgi:septal ring factor EnvC (AmiA/AmiB activator)
MSQKRRFPGFPDTPPDLPDPLEVLGHLESIIDEAQTDLTELDSHIRRVERKLSGMDHKIRVSTPAIEKPPATEREMVNLVRSHFTFSCPVCESIAEKVSGKLSNSTDKLKVYEAVYKLSASEDKKSQNEALKTLGDLGVLQDTMQEIRAGWEKLKEQETQK